MDETKKVRIGVLGGGAWGTALALHSARIGHDVKLWAREEDVVECINSQHENARFFPGHKLPESLKATSLINEVINHGELLLLVIPTAFIERVMDPVKDSIKSDQV